MHRMIMTCPCCSQVVELYRDGLSGPDKYRCGNCFEIIDQEDLDDVRALQDELARIEEQRKDAYATFNKRVRGD